MQRASVWEHRVTFLSMKLDRKFSSRIFASAAKNTAFIQAGVKFKLKAKISIHVLFIYYYYEHVALEQSHLTSSRFYLNLVHLLELYWTFPFVKMKTTDILMLLFSSVHWIQTLIKTLNNFHWLWLARVDTSCILGTSLWFVASVDKWTKKQHYWMKCLFIWAFWETDHRGCWGWARTPELSKKVCLQTLAWILKTQISSPGEWTVDSLLQWIPCRDVQKYSYSHTVICVGNAPLQTEALGEVKKIK